MHEGLAESAVQEAHVHDLRAHLGEGLAPSDLGVAEGDEADRYNDAEPETAQTSLGGS
jgi:hypothetical protein